MPSKKILERILLVGGISLGSVILLHSEEKQSQIIDNKAIAYFADSIGNQNGIIEGLEEDYIRMKLKSGEEFYTVTQGPSVSFEPWSPGIYKIYTSEQELRDDYKGTGIRGPVGILKFSKEGKITDAWSTGGYISKNKWKREDIPKIDFEKVMKSRLVY